MLSKFSVKKPYTVVVGIVLVLILGIVAATKMSADLLPNMNMPYAIVATSDMGASPEEIEEKVTAPIEAAMAKVSNIKKVSSQSKDSLSVVVLEFQQSANMDSVTVEMRESLDQLSSIWDDSVGNPMIMKMNPDMMPIMVAAGDIKGKSGKEITDYVEKELIPEIESIEGVASVRSQGEIQENIQVELSSSKIEALNNKIKKSLDQKFKDADRELAKTGAALEQQLGALSGGQNQWVDSTGATLNALNDEKIQLMQTKSQLMEKAGDLNDSRGELTKSLTQLNKLNATVNQLKIQIEKLEKLEKPDDVQKAALAALKSQLGEIEKQLPEGITLKTLPKAIKNAKQSLQNMEQGITALEQKSTDIEAGIAVINDNIGKLNSAQISGAAEMGSASAQVSSGEKQIEEAKKTLNETKKSAYAAADLTAVLTESTLESILTAQNFSMPAGYVEQEGKQYLVRVGDKLTSVEELEDLVLMDMGMDGMEPIRLKDVATIETVNNGEEVYAKVNGNSAVMLSIEKQTGYATGDVTNLIKDKFSSLMAENKDLHLTTLMDQGIYIEFIIKSVVENMIIGGILAIIILFFFLKDLKPTIVIAFSIPISVVAALVLMYFSKVTLNVISMSGLALGIGMLVDNSIVVIENIYRMRNEGADVREAAVKGAKQVTGAIVASTLTTICVFLPIVFTEGVTRQLFVDMGLTIAYALLASLLISLTLVPMMAAGLLKKCVSKKHPLFQRIQEFYGRILLKVLRFKPLVFIGVTIMLIVSIAAAATNGTAFMPEMDSTQMNVTLIPKEGTEFTAATALADEAMKQILKVNGVETVGAMAGASSGSLNSQKEETDISIYVILKEDKNRNNAEIGKEIEEKTKTLDCEVKVNPSSMDMSAFMSAGITLQIKGRDLDKLQKIAGDLGKMVEGVEGTTEVSDGLDNRISQLSITVDKEKASKYSLTVAQVYSIVYEKIAEATSSTNITTDTDEYQVFVSGDKKTAITGKDLEKITFDYKDKEGNEKKASLGSVIKIQEKQTLATISRNAQGRYMNVTAMIDEDHNVGKVSRDIQKLLKEYKLPNGYTAKMQGEDQTINDAFHQILLMLILAVAFIYLIMVAQFQSLLSPFIIMFTIPLAFTGGFLALFLGGKEISVIAMIGFVMLAGVIVNNGIVLVDYINQLRHGGMTKAEAIVEAGKTRLRPIFMTALTTILAMSTMAFGFGMGADMVQPMAMVTIGGMIYGTLLTLFVVPCLYDLFHREKKTIDKSNKSRYS
ncbi:MAG: efflux RND transporter permease subunit [Lachnospiraceae bacterium]